MKRKPLRAVSLFSNCGAGDIGYSKAGFKFVVMAELEKKRLEVCLLNHPEAKGVVGDLRKTWKEVVERYQELSGNNVLDLLAACPPCQGMSSARTYRGRNDDADAGMRDSRNLLATVIAKVVKALEPKIVVVENVQAFLTRNVRHPRTKKPITAAKLLTDLLAENYIAFPILVDLCDFGVPQSRKRSFITYVRKDIAFAKNHQSLKRIPYPLPPKNIAKIRSSLAVKKFLDKLGLPALDPRTDEKRIAKRFNILHSVPMWSEKQYQMIAAIPRHSGRSAWQNDTCIKCGHRTTNSEAVKCTKCKAILPRPSIGDGSGGIRLINGFRTSTYKRMHSKKPAPTVTTASGQIGSNQTIHPFENRILSTYECAMLQTLPRSFKWGDALKESGHTRIRQMIGEAVPPLFTYKHGRVLAAILTKNGNVRMCHSSDVRHTSAIKRLYSTGKAKRDFQSK